jgi:HEPN domain
VTPPDQWLNEALATRDMERVTANVAAAGQRINDARRHVRSARLLSEDDPTLAIAACHDAIRKAITAHMIAAGLRPRGGEGAHRIVLDYARHELPEMIALDDLREADDIRRDRGVAEYGDFARNQLTTAHIQAAAEVAERIVIAIARVLASQARARRP